MPARLGRARPNRPIILRSSTTTAPAPYTLVTYQFAGPGSKWMFTMAMNRISHLSLERVEITVTADADGLPYDPTTATAQMAFMSSPSTEPSSGDWKACNWDVTRIGSYVMQCLVGPSGTVTLTKGGYYVWAKLTDPAAGENPVEQVGRIFVQ